MGEQLQKAKRGQDRLLRGAMAVLAVIVWDGMLFAKSPPPSLPDGSKDPNVVESLEDCMVPVLAESEASSWES